MPSEILKIDQVAELLQLHVMTVYRLAKEGKLPGFKVGGRWRFHRDALEAWMVDKAQMNRIQAENQALKSKPKDGGSNGE
jgi:excisionase family DNA binding protein